MNKNKSCCCFGGLNHCLEFVQGIAGSTGSKQFPHHPTRFTMSGFTDAFVSHAVCMDDLDDNTQYILVGSGDYKCYAFDLNKTITDYESWIPDKVWNIANGEIMRCGYYE